jgi:hypothetical protein
MQIPTAGVTGIERCSFARAEHPFVIPAKSAEPTNQFGVLYRRLLQLRVLAFGGLEDGNLEVGVFPEFEKNLVGCWPSPNRLVRHKRERVALSPCFDLCFHCRGDLQNFGFTFGAENGEFLREYLVEDGSRP